jgi:hypothetical protein
MTNPKKEDHLLLSSSPVSIFADKYTAKYIADKLFEKVGFYLEYTVKFPMLKKHDIDSIQFLETKVKSLVEKMMNVYALSSVADAISIAAKYLSVAMKSNGDGFDKTAAKFDDACNFSHDKAQKFEAKAKELGIELPEIAHANLALSAK